MEVTSSYRLRSCVPSGVEFTSEKSVTSEELCVARVRRTTIDDETNTIYSSLALCQQRSKYGRDFGHTLVTVAHQPWGGQPTSNGLLRFTYTGVQES